MNKLLLVITLAVSFHTNAAFKTAQDLLFACNGTPDRNSANPEVDVIMFQGLCFGYISGMVDNYQIMRSLGAPPLFCPPEQGMALDQQLRIVVKHLENNPEALHETARVEVFRALVNAFPCD